MDHRHGGSPQPAPNSRGVSQQRRPPVRERSVQRPRAEPARAKPRSFRIVAVLLVVVLFVVAVVLAVHAIFTTRAPADAVTGNPAAQNPVVTSPGPLTLSQKIVEIADSQIGYRTDPANTYCNKYSAYFYSGTSDCGNSNTDEEWCADFAAWVWLKAGADVDYQFINGDINSSAASFYEWGELHGTWHPAGSGYTPQPGDVAVYGLDAGPQPLASHVAIVVGYHTGNRGPDVVNGDGDIGAFSIVQRGSDEYKADAPGSVAYLSGYVSPIPAG